MAASVLEQARVLGEPTRQAIFSYLCRQECPVGVVEITEEVGLHHSAVRIHLVKLRDAGLVLEETIRRGARGRPARSYRLTPGAIERWTSPGPYEELSGMLLELLLGDKRPTEVGRELGRRLAEEVSGHPADPLDAIEAVTRRLGFDIRRVGQPDDSRLDLVLANCPFAMAAEQNPGVICGLHRGVAEGVAEATGGSYEVTGLVIASPRAGGCQLQLMHVRR